MTARWKAGLPKRGELTRHDLSWGRILSPVSFLLFLTVALASGLSTSAQAENIDDVVPANVASGTGDGSSPLDGAVNEIRAYYGLHDLEVDWKLSSGLTQGIGALGPVAWEWTMDLPVVCPDRLVARVRSADPSSAAEYLIAGTTRIHRPAFRANRSLRKGVIVRENDIELTEAWVSPAARPADSPHDIVGTYVQSPIAKGAFVSATDVREAPQVQKGNEFRIEYHGTGLTVSGRGTSRRDAWIGDVITIRVAGARKDCRGTVAGPNLVVVERRN